MRALLAAMLLCGACAPGPDDAQWVSVTRDDLVIDVDVTGSLRAVDSKQITPPGIPGVWDYKIAMMAEEGAVVAEGDVVLAFDTTNLNRRLELKVAERDSAAKQLEMKLAQIRVTQHDGALELAQAEADQRKAELKADAPEELTAFIELQKLRLDREIARKQVAHLKRKTRAQRRRDEAEISRWRNERDRAEERVKEIGTAIEQMSINSPRAGTVIYETNWRGEKKKVGDSAWRAESLLEVASLEKMEAAGEVDEVDSARVEVGQVAALRLDAQPDVELRGKIREIARTVQRQSPDNPLKIMRLFVDLEAQGNSRLRPGMRFRGRIEVERIDDTLVVPLEAIVPTPDGPVAYRRDDGRLEAVSVTLGRRNKKVVEVTEGLDEDDQVQSREARDEDAP